MNPRVKEVTPIPDYTITLVLDNGEKKIFDMQPYLDKGKFRELKDMKIFNSVGPCLGTVCW